MVRLWKLKGKSTLKPHPQLVRRRLLCARLNSNARVLVRRTVKAKALFQQCQSAFNGDPLSASEYDPPPGGWDRWGGVRDPLLLSEVETTAQPDLFYADHPRLPFHRCTTKRSFCNQTRWVKLDADFPPSGSSLQAFPHLSPTFALRSICQPAMTMLKILFVPCRYPHLLQLDYSTPIRFANRTMIKRRKFQPQKRGHFR